MPWMTEKLSRHASSGAIRQFGPEYPSDITGDGPVSLEARLAAVFIVLGVATTHSERERQLSAIAQMHNAQLRVGDLDAISLVVTAVQAWNLRPWTAPSALLAHAVGVPQDVMHMWMACLVTSPHMQAVQALLALRLGREFSSDSMGDGPAARGAKVSQSTVPYARGSIYTGLPSAELAARADEILGQRLSSSSQQSINAALGHWRVVCSRHGWPEVILTDDPLRGGKLATFMMYLCDETDLAGVSIGNYTWALRTHMKQSRQLDPAFGLAEWDDWSESVQVEAWVPGEPRRMVPMELISAALQTVDLQSFQDVQAAVLLLMLLFSFARSETPCPKTADGLDPLQHLLVKDVVPHASPEFYVAMRLKRIKQDRRMERPEAQGNEDWVKLGDTSDPLFSLRVWFARLFALHGGRRGEDSAFFVDPRRRGGPLTYAQAMAHVRALYAKASSPVESAKYGLHSLRVTGYALSKRGAGEELTVAHGGWRSLAHRRYDRFAMKEVLALPEAMLAIHAESVGAPAAPTVVAAAASAAAVPALAAAAGARATPAAAVAPPLTRANCVGRRVLCPRSMWPSRACRMHGGAGWEALVRKVRTSGEMVEVFLEFVREPQCKLADKPMWVQLAILQPLR